MAGLFTERTFARYEPGAYTDAATGSGVGGSSGPHLVNVAGVAFVLGLLFVIEHFRRRKG